MSRNSIPPSPTFDRFGWYWQPAQWLENMSPNDARNATIKATGIESEGKTLQKQVNKQQKTAEESRTNQEEILKSLYDDN